MSERAGSSCAFIGGGSVTCRNAARLLVKTRSHVVVLRAILMIFRSIPARRLWQLKHCVSCLAWLVAVVGICIFRCVVSLILLKCPETESKYIEMLSVNL